MGTPGVQMLTQYQFSILDLRFWIASPSFSKLLAIPLVAPLKRIDISDSSNFQISNSQISNLAGCQRGDSCSRIVQTYENLQDQHVNLLEVSLLKPPQALTANSIAVSITIHRIQTKSDLGSKLAFPNPARDLN